MTTGWTRRREHRLTLLWNEGTMSASQIANELGGTTKNAVVGKANRMGLRERKPGPWPPATRESLIRRKGTQKHRRLVTKVNGHCFEAKEDKPLPPEPEPLAVKGKTLMELKDSDCHWPIGDPADRKNFCYCGLPRAGRYCAFHSKL